MVNQVAHLQSPGDDQEVSLVEVQNPLQIAAAAELMRAFVDWARVRYAEDGERLDAYFNPDGFEEELARLPEPFEAPAGRLLLARVGGVAAGCIAFKPLRKGVCEMKRLYLKPDCHGLGIGRLLVERLIELASEIGYNSMVLETGPLQVEAQKLYASFGFRRIPPYRNLPDCLRYWLICMERPLGAASAMARPPIRLAASA